MAEIVETRFTVAGVRTSDEVKAALQQLYDVFADEGMGQATFELDPSGGPAHLIVKHVAGLTPNRAVINAQLAKAGPFALAGD